MMSASLVVEELSSCLDMSVYEQKSRKNLHNFVINVLEKLDCVNTNNVVHF